MFNVVQIIIWINRQCNTMHRTNQRQLQFTSLFNAIFITNNSEHLLLLALNFFVAAGTTSKSREIKSRTDIILIDVQLCTL